MNKRLLVGLTLSGLLLLIMIITPTPAHALKTNVFPAKISQGDPFVVKVTGTKSPDVPAASVAGRDLSFSSCGEGCFLAVGAVDMNTKPGVYWIRLASGVKRVKMPLRVKRAAFPTIKLTLPKEKVTPGPEDLKRIEEEDNLLRSFWPMRSERLWEGAFIQPIGTPLSTEFGTKRVFNNGERVSVHKGVDFRGRDGEEVKASNSGMVILAAELFFGGNTVILDHGQGIYTVYMHLSGFMVNPGDKVAKGNVIGFVGSSGRSTGPHLHFGLKVMELNANPVSLFKLSI